jgi:hypothetical protein
MLMSRIFMKLQSKKEFQKIFTKNRESRFTNQQIRKIITKVLLFWIIDPDLSLDVKLQSGKQFNV